MSRQPNDQKRTYEKPLSLSQLTFHQAVDKLVKAKPTKSKNKSKPGKPQ